MIKKLIYMLKGEEEVVRKGTIELDIQRDGKRYIAGRNEEAGKIFIEIRSNEGLLKRIVKPCQSFLGGCGDYNILAPFKKMVLRGIPFKEEDWHSYKDQFEAYTTKEDITFSSFNVKDMALVHKISAELERLKEKVSGVEVIPEIFDYKIDFPIGNVILNYAELSGRFETPGHSGISLLVKNQDEKIDLIGTNRDLEVVKFSPKNKVLMLGLGGETRTLYTDGGYGFDGRFAQELFMTPGKIARWYVNKAEHGLVEKDKLLTELRKITS